MKGIDGILARAGKSETRTGTEVELDFDSILTGTGIEMTMPNASGAFFMKLKSGAADTDKFTISEAGAVVAASTLTATGEISSTAGLTSGTGFTVTTGGAAITGDVVVTSGEFTGTLDEDNDIGGSDLRDGQYVIDRERRYMEYFNDFCNVTDCSATDWTITDEVSDGSFTVADAALGVGALVTAGSALDSESAVTVNEFVKLVHGKKTWFEARVKIDEMTQTYGFIGLSQGGTNMASGTTGCPTNAADWIGFTKADGSAKWHFTIGTQIGDVLATGSSTPQVATGVTDTYMRLGFMADCTGVTTATPYIDGVAGSAPTEMTSGSGTSYPYGTELGICAALNTTQGAAATMSIDYIHIVVER